jgi:hypothetical protein
LQAEPLDIYLEETFIDELRTFFAALPLDILNLRTAASDACADGAAAVLASVLRAATVNTTIADPKDLFGKWCVPCPLLAVGVSLSRLRAIYRALVPHS